MNMAHKLFNNFSIIIFNTQSVLFSVERNNNLNE